MSALAGEGQNVWNYISLTLSKPWFLVSYIAHSHEGDIGETLLLSCPSQVVDVLKKSTQEIEVRQVQLVSPKHLNNSLQWQMDPLLEVWRGTGENAGAYTYVLEDGRQYINTLGVVDSAQTNNMTCLFRFERMSREDTAVCKVFVDVDDQSEASIRLIH